jgi:TctA family transporter
MARQIGSAMLDAWVAGIQGLLQVRELIFLSLGMGIGLVFGALPGLGGATALALLMPLTYGLEPFTAVALAGNPEAKGRGPADGRLTAILLNAPGSAPNAATCLDGYPLAQQGKAGYAIGAAATANSLGGIIGTVSVLAAAAGGKAARALVRAAGVLPAVHPRPHHRRRQPERPDAARPPHRGHRPDDRDRRL